MYETTQTKSISSIDLETELAHDSVLEHFEPPDNKVASHWARERVSINRRKIGIRYFIVEFVQVLCSP